MVARRPLLAALALALAALIALLAFALRARPAVTSDVDVDADVTATRGAVARESRDAELAGTDAAPRDDAMRAGADVQHAAPSTAARAHVGDPIRLVDARTGAALPGAALRCVPWPPSGGIDVLAADQAVERADALIADANGVVLLPPLFEGVAVAHTDSLWGWTNWRKGAAPPSELRLDVDRDLRVKVLGPSGEPAIGVPISLRASRGSMMRRVRSTRAPDGIVRFPASDLAPRADGAAARLSVALDALAPEPCAIELLADDLAGAPRVLRVPALATVDVIVRELDGRVAPDDTRVWLRLAAVEWPSEDVAGSADASNAWREPQPEASSVYAVTRAGRARFAVAAGEHELYVECRRDRAPTPRTHEPQKESDKRAPSARARARAPRAGETARIDAVLDEEWGLLVGRALDASGEPLRAVVLLARGMAGEQTVCSQTITNEAGEFWIECNESGWERVDTLDLVTSGGAPRRARVPLTRGRVGLRAVADAAANAAAPAAAAASAPREPHALGDVVFTSAAPLLLRGRVVGSDPTVLAGARVRARARSASGVWSEVAHVGAGDDAVFELGVEAEWGPLRMSARTIGWESLPRIVDPLDTRPLELELLPWGTLVGSVRLPDGATSADCAIELRVTRERVGNMKHVTLDADGRFESPPLEADGYTLVATLAKTDIELARVGGLRVEPARALRFARVDPLDLSGALRRVELEIVDEQRAPIPDAEVEWRPRSGSPFGFSAAPQHSTATRDGRVRQWLGRRAVDAIVRADGFVDARVDDVSGEHRVVLRRVRMLELALAAGSARPDPASDLVIVLQRNVDAGEFAVVARARFDATGRAAIGIAGPGRYRVAFALPDRPALEGATLAAAQQRCGVVLDVDAASFAQPLRIDALAEWWTEPPPPATNPAPRPLPAPHSQQLPGTLFK